MRRRAERLPYVVATLLLGFMVVAAWVARDRFRPVIAGEVAPDFSVQDLNGNPVSLTDYEGKVVLLNIWATWCGPCKEEMPSMERLYRQMEGEDFEILAVSVDAALGETDQQGNAGASKERLAEFASEYDLTFPILHDPAGRIQTTYQTTGVPESFLLDRDGVIHRRLAGATVWDHDRYRELIRSLLDG
jgi:cytochrome c biogenesis protein CcmG/thiol:disulfide interchange protein DsbE